MRKQETGDRPRFNFTTTIVSKETGDRPRFNFTTTIVSMGTRNRETVVCPRFSRNRGLSPVFPEGKYGPVRPGISGTDHGFTAVYLRDDVRLNGNRGLSPIP
jgi:hypothetical protein